LEGRQKTLEAAYLVYDQFWGKDFDQVLQPVPNCGNSKYLAKQQIDSLGVRRLRYPEDVLLVREEYTVAYSALQLYKKEDASQLLHTKRSGGVVVTGQPGIGMNLMWTMVFFADNCHPTPNPGKTCFLYYLLFFLLSERKTVAFQVNKHFILFRDTGVRMVESSPFTAHAIPQGTWALTDSHASSTLPCEAFLDSSGAGNAWIVQTSSPSPNRWEEWHKQRTALKYWMDVFSLDELTTLG
jgi:hypothetical protein